MIDVDAEAAAIRAMIEQTVLDWNAGSITRFMCGYKNDDSTSYVGGGCIVTGAKAIHSMYEQRFAAGSARMGSLAVEILHIRNIPPDHAYAIGRFNLNPVRTVSTPITGHTTLLLQRTSDGWRIIGDHSG